MKTKMRLQGLMLGVVLTVLVSSFIAPALAAVGNTLFNTVNITVDGTQIASIGQNYTLQNGSQTPNSIVYNNTTYLPIRRISEIIGKPITWDQNTSTVVVGTSAPAPTQQYYPGTNILTFEAVTGTPLKYTSTDDGQTGYVYEYHKLGNDGESNFINYADYLFENGFYLFDDDATSNYYAVYMVKDNVLISFAYYAYDNEIIVLPPVSV